MFDLSFFRTRVGQASLASVAAMTAFVALSGQIQTSPAYAATTSYEAVELA